MPSAGADVSAPAVPGGSAGRLLPLPPAAWAGPCQSPGWLPPPPLLLPQTRPPQNSQKHLFKKCVREIPLMPKILPQPASPCSRNKLPAPLSSPLTSGEGRRPCGFPLCSLTTSNSPGACVSRDFGLVFLCLASSLRGCRFLPSRSQLKHHLPCGVRGETAAMAVLPGPPPLFHSPLAPDLDLRCSEPVF